MMNKITDSVGKIAGPVGKVAGQVAEAGGSIVGIRHRTEEPPFTVERRLGDVEIRRYGSRIAAETSIDANEEAARTEGFRRLARYIFGGNKGNTKIAMTAPVAQEQAQKIAMTAPVAAQRSGTGQSGELSRRRRGRSQGQHDHGGHRRHRGRRGVGAGLCRASNHRNQPRFSGDGPAIDPPMARQLHGLAVAIQFT